MFKMLTITLHRSNMICVTSWTQIIMELMVPLTTQYIFIWLIIVLIFRLAFHTDIQIVFAPLLLAFRMCGSFQLLTFKQTCNVIGILSQQNVLLHQIFSDMFLLFNDSMEKVFSSIRKM